jgi:branched-chain amino acid transport system substrate-binding protein
MKSELLTIKAFLIFFSLLQIYSTTKAEEPIPVTIGLVYPLTGPMSSFSADIIKAAPLIEEQFNSLQNEYVFKLKFEDGMFGQSNAAITSAKKLIELDQVKFIVTGSSGEALQIAPYVEAHQILTVAGFASHPAVKDAGDYIFRTYVDIDDGVKLLSERIIKEEIKKVAVITESTSFTTSIKDSFDKYLSDRIVFSEEYAFGESDFATLIAKAKVSRPELYYLNTASPATFITLVQRLRSNGVTEPIYTYYLPSLSEVQNALSGQLSGIVYLDYPETLNESEDFRNLVSEYKKRNGEEIKAFFNFRTNYNAIRVIFDAIINVGLDAEKAKNYLYDYDQPSATGRLRFDKNGDATGLEFVLKTY